MTSQSPDAQSPDAQSPELPTNSILGRGIRTFKPRRSRMTQSQRATLASNPPALQPFVTAPMRQAWDWPPPDTQLFLDIGCGNGVSTIALAEQHPDHAFLAVDIHTPGLGDLLGEISNRTVTNIRVVETDSIALLEHMVEDNSISGVFTLFPDPWPKARHHKRRIVQPAIVELMYQRLVPGGFWHIATDWQEYADSIADIFASPVESTRWSGGTVPRPARPVTHYEKRALREGRDVTDFRFYKMPVD